MKKLYTIGLGLTFVLMATHGFSQVNKTRLDEPVLEKAVSVASPVHKKPKANLSKDFQVFWSEDFSNGFDGQGSNGEWTTAMDQGDLWFQTFPMGEPNGYDPDAALTGLPAYGDHIPNFFGSAAGTVESETASNGLMMLDADRYNSTTTPDTPGGNTSNPILSALVSPSIDLSGAGTTGIALKFFERVRMCCSGYSATAEVSTDGGTTWIPYDVFSPYGGGNDDIQELVYIDISGTLASASDLSDVKVRFVWSGSATVYYWSIDDVSIETLADNNLSLTTTYFTDYQRAYNDPDADYYDYYNTLEYNQQPEYYVHPFTFGGIVTNLGLATQTGVQIHVNVTLPDGTTVIPDFAVSDPIDMEPGETDTIFTPTVTPDLSLLGDAAIGTWTFDYVVLQNEDDQIPFYNDGPTRTAAINSEATNTGVLEGFGLMANDAGMTSGSSTAVEDGDDQIWGTAYTFPESTADQPKYITHIQAVLLNNGGFRETQPLNQIFFNVREGAAYAEDPDDPEAPVTSVFFDSDNLYDYSDASLRHVIQEEDIWYSDELPSGQPVPRITFELPVPVLIDPTKIYQAEFRVPNNGGVPIVYGAVCIHQENSSSPMYSGGSAEWHGYTELTNAIRFLTATSTDVPQISNENGLELVQNYPNPFTTSTKIQYRVNESAQVTLELRDVAGKLVFSKDMGMASAGIPVTYDLQRGDLAPGVYTYSIVTPAHVVTRKLTVQ